MTSSIGGGVVTVDDLADVFAEFAGGGVLEGYDGDFFTGAGDVELLDDSGGAMDVGGGVGDEYGVAGCVGVEVGGGGDG